jgi:hypothetical protein
VLFILGLFILVIGCFLTLLPLFVMCAPDKYDILIGILVYCGIWLVIVGCALLGYDGLKFLGVI